MSQSVDELVCMINRTAAEARARKPMRAVALAYEQIWTDWDEQMRSTIVDYHRAGGQGLSPIAAAVAQRLALVQEG